MRSVATTLTLTAALLLAACGGNGETPEVDPVAQLEACLGTGMDNFLESLGGLATLLGVASDPDNAAALGVTWTEATPTVYNFTIPVDLDGDGNPDGQFQGSATFDSPPAEGLGVGDELQVNWDLNGHATLMGDGDIHVRLGATGLELWGEIGFADQSGDCSFEFSTDEASPLSIEIPGVWPPAPAATYGDLSIVLNGNGQLTVKWNGNTLTAVVSYPPEGNWVDITQITVTINNGLPQSRPDIMGHQIGDVPPDTFGLDLWVGTWKNEYASSSFITQETIIGTEEYVISLGPVVNKVQTLNVAVTDTTFAPDVTTYGFVLTLESDTEGRFTYVGDDAYRYHLGSGVSIVEERGTLSLFVIPEVPPRIFKRSSHGEPDFTQLSVEGSGSLSKTEKQ